MFLHISLKIYLTLYKYYNIYLYEMKKIFFGETLFKFFSLKWRKQLLGREFFYKKIFLLKCSRTSSKFALKNYKIFFSKKVFLLYFMQKYPSKCLKIVALVRFFCLCFIIFNIISNNFLVLCENIFLLKTFCYKCL